MTARSEVEEVRRRTNPSEQRRTRPPEPWIALLAFEPMARSHRPSPPPRDVAIEDILGPLAAAVMRAVWSDGESSVASVVSAINTVRRPPLAYTTILTIMTRLYERGVLTREKSGRQYVYRPTGDESALLENLSARAVDALLARYGTTALRQFGARLADADPNLRAQVLALATRRSR